MQSIRPIREEERAQVAALFNNAFRIGPATGAAWIQDVPLEETLAWVDDAARVQSFLRIVPYTVHIGGRPLAMGGIGGVCTWADQQGRGQASALMRRSLEVMRARGQAVSMLYPFSVRYYRKFGWETVGERITYTDQPTSNLPEYEEAAQVRRAQWPDDLPAFAAAYRAGFERFNCLCERSPERWKAIFRELEEKRGQAYLIEREGRPAGYFLCENHPLPEGGYESRTRDYIVSDPAACRAMLGFIARLPPLVKRVTIVAPARPRLTALFKEPPPMMRLQAIYQFRVVDLQKAVEARGIPCAAEGAITLRISDPAARWNDGLWTLRFAQGRAQCVPAGDKAVPDMEMSIQTFSQVFCGYLDPLELGENDQNTPPDPAPLELLRRAFYDRPVHLLEAF